MRASSYGGKFFSIVSMAALAILVAGCRGIVSPDLSTLNGAMAPLPAAASGAATGAGAEVAAAKAQDLPPAQDREGGPGAARPATARQMVYTARFDIATSNVEDAMSRFIRGVESAGGYLESREDSHVVCRVPADRFQEIVAAMPSLGNIVSQTIRNDDVTRQYHDLKLHIETAEWSRRRVLGLLEKAEKIEDIIKLEEELLKLTATIEGLQGLLRDLSEQIAYSRIEAVFRARVAEAKLGRPDAYSPFAWINQVGAEQVVEGFGPVGAAGNSGVGPVAMLPAGLSTRPLDGFLVVKSDRCELRAITPEGSKLWVREFAVPRRANLAFWSKALRSDLVEHRGYQLLEEKQVRDGKGNEGVELVCDVVVQGQTHRYLVGVYAPDGPFWQRGSTIRTVEFAAPVATFDRCAAAVRACCGQAQAGPRREPAT